MDRHSLVTKIRQRIEEGELVEEFYDHAVELLYDTDPIVRWQAAIVLSEFIPTKADAVLDVVLKSAGLFDEDFQQGAGTVLLEHLLEHNFDNVMNRIRQRVDVGDRQILGVLECCWPFGEEATKKWNRVTDLFTEQGVEYKPWFADGDSWGGKGDKSNY